MLSFAKAFIKEEDGLGTVEIVVIIAILVGIALIFRSAIFSFVKSALNKIIGQGNAAFDDIDAD